MEKTAVQIGNMDNSDPAFVESDIDLPDEKTPVTVATASVAPTWHSEDGNLDSLRARGFTAWSTFASAFDGPFGGENARYQALAQVRYRQGEMLVDPNDSKHTAKQNLILAALERRITENVCSFPAAGSSSAKRRRRMNYSSRAVFASARPPKRSSNKLSGPH